MRSDFLPGNVTEAETLPLGFGWMEGTELLRLLGELCFLALDRMVQLASYVLQLSVLFLEQCYLTLEVAGSRFKGALPNSLSSYSGKTQSTVHTA